MLNGIINHGRKLPVSKLKRDTKINSIPRQKKSLRGVAGKKKIGFNKLSFWKLALGIIALAFLLDYHPALSIPLLRKGIVNAQIEQVQTITGERLPFEFQLPHPGYMSTQFSSYHPGIDIATGLGFPIKPIAKGVVLDEGYNFWGLGLNVIIDHGNGYRSLYAHMGKIYVKKGQEVSMTDYLGEVGLTGRTTGPHTHLEIYRDGTSIDPLAVLPAIRQIPVAEDFKAVGGQAYPKSKIIQTPKHETTSQPIKVAEQSLVIPSIPEVLKPATKDVNQNLDFLSPLK